MCCGNIRHAKFNCNFFSTQEKAQFHLENLMIAKHTQLFSEQQSFFNNRQQLSREFQQFSLGAFLVIFYRKVFLPNFHWEEKEKSCWWCMKWERSTKSENSNSFILCVVQRKHFRLCEQEPSTWSNDKSQLNQLIMHDRYSCSTEEKNFNLKWLNKVCKITKYPFRQEVS